jgi:Tfp pilus assembly protein PilN
MIRTNLSTRPFYNERTVHAWLAAAALIVVGATVFNVTRLVHYSRSDTQLGAQASRDEARAADLRTEAARLRATVDARQVETASADARQANDLIDRRIFSWTELFNRFESTLPDEVRITAVRPAVNVNAGTLLTINVVAADTDDVSEFMENLEATGAFSELRGTSEERYNQQGQLEAVIETRYRPTPPAAGTAPTSGEAGR